MRALTRPVVLLLLFCSGATGLVYELVWSKRLANLLGNSGQAHAIVLATFMGGLALGAFLLGGAADRVRRPLRLYGLLELGVGLYAALFKGVLGALSAAYLELAPSLDGAPRTTLKLALAAASLLLPTVLMGGTVPALTRELTSHLAGARKNLSLLYAVNSLGAALGVLLAGVWLVPEWGLDAIERSAAALNIALGLAAVLAARGAPAPQAPGGEPAPAESYTALAVRAATLGVLLSGFTSMLYEITWIRLLAIVLGGTTYSFTLILFTFICGIGLGSLWLTRRPDTTDSLATFAWLQLMLAGSVCLALPYYGRLPYLFHHVLAALGRGPATWPVYQVVSFACAAAVLVVPTFFMGASFPAAARIAMRSVSTLGRSLGGVYLWNTLGTVSGSLLGGLVLLPLIGLEKSFALALAANLVAAGAALLASRPTRRRGVAFAALAAVVVTVLVTSAGWSTVAATSGRYREWNRTFESYGAFRAAVDALSEVRFSADDVFASVMVGRSKANPKLQYMRINGKIDASSGDDIDTQVLAGHLGALLHDGGPPKRVLLIGMGAGITAGSLLTHDLERLDIVEISPAVIEAARLFGADNLHALDDPRAVVTIDDARTFLLLSKHQYDLIVSVPSNPWVSGVSGLFSRDFFQVLKGHLAPGARVVQWIHTYESSEEMVSLVIRTLRDSFAHGTTWVGPQDLVMVASDSEVTIEPALLAERMAAPKVKADLARVRVHDVTTLLARQVHSDAGQRAAGGAGPINSDDLNRLEFGSARAYFIAAHVAVPDDRRSRDRGAALALPRWLEHHPLDAEQARRIYESLEWVHDADDPLVWGAAVRWRALAPDDELAALAVARAAWAQRDVDAAVEVLRPSIARGGGDPRVVALWLTARARQERRTHSPWRQGSLEAERRLAEAALARSPGHPELEAAAAAVRAP